MKVLLLLGIGQIMLVPSKHKAIPIPLSLSASEKSVINVFRPRFGETVLDIGAYVGRYTLLSSRYVGEKGQVVSVEAHPGIFKLLRKNLILNKISNATTVNAAISNCEGHVKLYHGYASGWHSIVQKSAETGWSLNEYTKVPSRTVDNLMKEIGIDKVDWMKIDVEGAELKVLEGSLETLRNNENLKIIVEIHPTYTREDAIFKLFKQMQYETRVLKREWPYQSYHTLAWSKQSY